MLIQERFAATLAFATFVFTDIKVNKNTLFYEGTKKQIRSLAALFKTILINNDSILGISLEDGTKEGVDGHGITRSRSL